MRDKAQISLIIIPLIILFFIVSCSEEKVDKYQSFKKNFNENYLQAVDMLSKRRDFSEDELNKICRALDPFRNPEIYLSSEIEYYGKSDVDNVLKMYPDGKWLANYADALRIYNGTPSVKRTYRTNAEQYAAAVKAIDEIPEHYSGVLADRIKEDRAVLKKRAAETKGLQEAAQAEENAILHIGDPEYKIEQIYGPPIKINTDISANNEHNQYVYADKFIYTDNGRVTNFQTR